MPQRAQLARLLGCLQAAIVQLRTIPEHLAASPEPDWKRLHRVADAHAPDLVHAFMDLVSRAREQTSLARLEAELGIGDVEAALRSLPWSHLVRTRLPLTLTPVIEATFNAAATVSLRQLRASLTHHQALGPQERWLEDISVDFAFNLLNPRALTWIQTHAGELIREIDEAQMLAIRQLMELSFTEGLTPHAIAELIRDEIGLTERQMQAVQRLADKLLEQGLSSDIIAQEVEDYIDRLMRFRAETIALTETLAAANAGMLELWQQARDEGFLPAETRRFWVVTPDDRLEELCEAILGMNAAGVGLDEPFDTPLGPIMAPPLHPRCRCVQALSAS